MVPVCSLRRQRQRERSSLSTNRNLLCARYRHGEARLRTAGKTVIWACLSIVNDRSFG